MPAFESNRSTCLIACLLNRPRAAANPSPMVETANDALVIIPCVAFASEYTRFACRSSPTRLIIKLWMSLKANLWQPAIVSSIVHRMGADSYSWPLLFGIIHVPFDSFISQNEGNAEVIERIPMKRVVTAALAVFGLVAVAAPALAQPYPNRTVTIIVPYSAGRSEEHT